MDLQLINELFIAIRNKVEALNKAGYEDTEEDVLNNLIWQLQQDIQELECEKI